MSTLPSPLLLLHHPPNVTATNHVPQKHRSPGTSLRSRTVQSIRRASRQKSLNHSDRPPLSEDRF
jgi:hypothetical protein